MRDRILYAVLFIAFATVAAVVQWPAASLSGWSEQAGRGRWKIAAAEGTLWNGSATVVVAADAVAGRWQPVQKIRWMLSGNELWRGRLTYDVALEQGSVRVVFGGEGVRLEKLDAQVPAAIVAGLISGPVGRYGWSGTLSARSSNFSCALKGQDCRGEVEMVWRDAGVAEISGLQLGSYVIRLVGEGSAVHFTLGTLAGTLQIVGRGQVGAGGLRFSGQASAGPDAGPLEAKLRTLGQPGGAPGWYVIEYRESAAAE